MNPQYSSAGPHVLLTRKVSFCASHRYHNDAWSDEKNREVFGPCNNPYGHGHNYELEVTLSGPVERDTGMVMNLTDIDAVLREQVVDVLDHRFLNKEIDAFSDIIPTTENIAQYIWNALDPLFRESSARLHRVRLWESPTLYVELLGDSREESSREEGAS